MHVDASKGMVTWAKENVMSSGLGDRPVRYIVDDVVKFVQRENRRGHQYDAIIMDPPSYGRGPSGEVWKIENELYPLIEECMKILSDKPLFFLINSYTTGLSAQVLINVLSMTVGRKYGGKITADEIGLTMKSNILPCGINLAHSTTFYFFASVWNVRHRKFPKQHCEQFYYSLPTHYFLLSTK